MEIKVVNGEHTTIHKTNEIDSMIIEKGEAKLFKDGVLKLTIFITNKTD